MANDMGPARSPMVLEMPRPFSAKVDAHWLTACSLAPAQTIMIFSEREVDARGKLFKYAKTNGVVQEFKRLSEAELSGWILRRFDKAGRKIQRSAMQLFLERVGNDMSQINLEMQKLIDYTEGKDAIRLEDVSVTGVDDKTE